jgi:hypothetical protein
VLPLVGAAGILVAITLNVDPIHDIDLFGSKVPGSRSASRCCVLSTDLGRRPRPLWSDGATRL